MKKLLLASALGLILALTMAAPALAGPPSPPDYGEEDPTGTGDCPPIEWGVEKCKPPYVGGESTHIVTDPLEPTGVDEDAEGWVNFWCSSTVGFQYHIGASGLEPRSTYTVTASGWQVAPAAEGDTGWGGSPAFEIYPGFWVVLVGPVQLDLGALRTDANGLGSVHGIEGLAPGMYGLNVQVKDGSAVVVLEMPADDQADFLVY